MIGALALLLVGCGGGEEDEAAAEEFAGVPLELQDPGPVHVHGLGYDPQGKTLYLATHTGMFELADGAAKAVRVGESHQDTMGFTLIKPNLFLGSGHPDARAELPPHLGLIRSTDRGRSWKPVSLLGEADFHVLRARGTTIYGFDSSNERLLASRDSGRTWTRLAVPEVLLDLAVDPTDAKHVVASGGAVLYRSNDGGETWRAIASGVSGYLAWPGTKRLFVATLDGAFLSADRAGGSWTPRGTLGAPVAALLAVNERTLFAALHDGTIKQSGDGGMIWKVRATP
jgi:photosystem II stability/assembly factor-like uncharacterized protein